jgi:hypothetical protein
MEHKRTVGQLVVLSALLGIAGCADQHDFTAVTLKDPVTAIQESGGGTTLRSALRLDVIPLYEKDGHIATSGFIADMLGLDAMKIESFSCYSQAPDDLAYRYSAPAVAIWAFPAYTGYRRDVVNSLHSLHGGNAQAVEYRRQKLESLVRQSFISNRPDWQTGFLIHALGDSYAHVYSKNGQLQAYGEFMGHAFDNTPWGEKPDLIFVNGHAEIYVSYVSALFRALSPTGGVSEESKKLLEMFKKRIRSEALKGNAADKTAVFLMPKNSGIYVDTERSDKNCVEAYGRLNNTKVRAFLRLLSAQLSPP